MPPHAAASLAAAAVATHVLLLLPLGARSLASWLPVLGIGLIVGGCAVASVRRTAIRWPTVTVAFGLQYWFAVLLTRTDCGVALSVLSCGVSRFLGYAAAHPDSGARFVFGDALVDAGVFAFTVVPAIVFFAAVTAVLLHLGLVQLVLEHVGGAFANLLQVSPVEGVLTLANVFFSMTEAPLLLKPLLPTLTRSQLFAVMTGGFASVAGSVLAAFIGFGIRADQLLAACLMSAPAALAIAKLLVPDDDAGPGSRFIAAKRQPSSDEIGVQIGIETNGVSSTIPAAASASAAPELEAGKAQQAALRVTPASEDHQRAAPHRSKDASASADASRVLLRGRPASDGVANSTNSSVMEAVTSGAVGAIPVSAAVVAMLIATVSLVALLNDSVEWLASLVGIEGLTFTKLLGYGSWPIALLMGVPPHECLQVGELIGIKLVVNEFVAFQRLGELIAEGELSQRSELVATYALCGFSNLGSMGIMLGALSGMAPELRPRVARDVFRALIAGTLACFSTACIASALFEGASADRLSYEC